MIERPTIRCAIVAIAALVGALIVSLFERDTYVRRRFENWRIARIATEARQHPGDSQYAKRLVAIARGTYSFGAMRATVAIGNLGEGAREVIGDLGELLDSTDPYVEREAALALEKLGPISEPALPFLERKVREGSPANDATAFAALAIGRIGERGRRSLPLLRSKLGLNEIFDDCLQQAIKALEAS